MGKEEGGRWEKKEENSVGGSPKYSVPAKGCLSLSDFYIRRREELTFFGEFSKKGEEGFLGKRGEGGRHSFP